MLPPTMPVMVSPWQAGFSKGCSTTQGLRAECSSSHHDRHWSVVLACHGGLRNIPLSVLGRQVSVRDVIPPTNACHGGLRNILALSPWQAGFSKGRNDRHWSVVLRPLLKPPPTNACCCLNSSLSPCRQVSVRDVIPPTNACHGGLRNIPLSVLGRQVSVRDVVPPTNACGCLNSSLIDFSQPSTFAPLLLSSNLVGRTIVFGAQAHSGLSSGLYRDCV